MPATLEARPAVFIGLGGAGSSVVSYLKRSFLNHFGQGNSELNKLQFIALDTSRPDYEKLQREFGDSVLRENDEWFSLGQFNPYREYQEYKEAIRTGRMISSYESLKQWLDERAASRFFDRRIEDGASADRQQGRLCFWKRSDDFEVTLTQKIKRAYDLITAMQRGSGASTPALEVYVISGTCGGTGSSCFLDICYDVNRIYQSPAIGAHEEPRVRGVLFLPFRYIAMQRESGAPESTVHRYQANGYGFFEEIEYLLWDKFLRGQHDRRGKAIHRLSVKSEDPAIRSLDFSFRPFQMALLVDDKTDQNETIRDRDLYPNTAKALFHMFLSSATDSIDSAYNNVETNLQNLNPQTLKFGSVPAYATFGYRSVEYPRDQLMRYFRDRFAYEALDRGLLRSNDVKQDEIARHVQEAAGRLVYDFLIQKGSDPTADNFEKLAREATASLPDEVDLAEFYHEQEDEEKAPKLDTRRVTVDRLRKAIGLAESKAEHARTVIRAEYMRLAEGDDEKKGLRRVKMGLKSLIDERVPRYGMRYVEHLLFSLDGLLTEKYLQLEKELFARSTEATELLEEALGQIDEVASKPKKKLEEFKRLLQSYVQVVIEQSLLEHQLLFLKAVSKEESIETSGGARKQTLPLIDQSIDQVKKIIKLLNDDLMEQASETYLRDLKKEFDAREQDVMTEYVPRLTSLLQEGSIADRLYRQVIRPEDEEMRAALLKEALQREDKTQAIEGLSFYLSDLYDPDRGGREPSLGVELLDRLRRFAVDKLRLHPEGSKELRKPLLDVIEGFGRTEQDRLRANFRAIRTLCPLDSARLDADMSYIAYAFADEALGRKLGMGDDDISKKWARDDDPTKIVGIVLKTHVNKEGVAGLRSIEHIYKHRNRQANLPHIKKEWNDFGPKEAESADAKAGALALGLACDWAVRKLLQEKAHARDEIFSNKDPRTNRLQHVAPIFSKENSRKVYEIIGCVPEKDERGRLMFKEANNIKLSPSVDYNAARASLALHPEIENAVEEFAEMLEMSLGPETLKQYLEEYYNALDQKHQKMDRNDEQEPVIAKMLDMLERRLSGLVPDTLDRPVISGPVV